VAVGVVPLSFIGLGVVPVDAALVVPGREPLVGVFLVGVYERLLGFFPTLALAESTEGGCVAAVHGGEHEVRGIQELLGRPVDLDDAPEEKVKKTKDGSYGSRRWSTCT